MVFDHRDVEVQFVEELGKYGFVRFYPADGGDQERIAVPAPSVEPFHVRKERGRPEAIVGVEIGEGNAGSEAAFSVELEEGAMVVERCLEGEFALRDLDVR